MKKNRRFYLGMLLVSIMLCFGAPARAQLVAGVSFDFLGDAAAAITPVFEQIQTGLDEAVKFAKEKMGFRNIVLGGHSLGSNKIINYLSINHDPVIKHFVISGPVDYADFINAGGRKSYYLNVAENFVKEGRGDDILPFLFVDFSPMSANTLLQWYSNKSFKNCPILSGDGETESLNKISVNGVFIIGEKDSCTGGNAFEFASKINSYTKNPKDNEIVIIPDAGHVFYNKHNEYAETVLNYIKSKEITKISDFFLLL